MSGKPESAKAKAIRRTLGAGIIVAGMVHATIDRALGPVERTLLIAAGCIILAWGGWNILRKR